MRLTSMNRVCGLLTMAGLALGGCASQTTTSGSLTPKPDAGAPTEIHPTSPYEVGLTGGDDLGFTSASDRSGRAWDAPYGFYGQIMSAGAQKGSADEAWNGLENLSQSSFALEGSDFDPCVTPDGQKIIFASTQHTPTANLYIKGVDSRTVTQLTNDPSNNVMPKVSPDGTRIAFASNRAGTWDLYVMPARGGRALQVTSEATAELHPTWSPDGKLLAFCRLGVMSNKWEVWITDVQNSGVSQFLTYGLFPEWCPVAGTGQDGTDRILFQRSRERGDRSFSVWTVDYKDGRASGATEIVASAVAACINPSWSPDAAWITFSTVPSAAEWATSGDGRPSSANLWMVSSQGGGLVSLTSGEAVNLMPTWGSNNRLFFISDRGGVENIWHMDAADAIIAATGGAGHGTAVGHHALPGAGHGDAHGEHEAVAAEAGHENATAVVEEHGGH